MNKPHAALAGPLREYTLTATPKPGTMLHRKIRIYRIPGSSIVDAIQRYIRWTNSPQYTNIYNYQARLDNSSPQKPFSEEVIVP